MQLRAATTPEKNLDGWIVLLISHRAAEQQISSVVVTLDKQVIICEKAFDLMYSG